MDIDWSQPQTTHEHASQETQEEIAAFNKAESQTSATFADVGLNVREEARAKADAFRRSSIAICANGQG